MELSEKGESGMPDWSYQTLFRPVLFRLPAETARDMTLKAFGTLGRIPGGSLLIKTLGHMEQTDLLIRHIGNMTVKYPVGLGAGLDVHSFAHRSLSQIGFGFIELGPVTEQAIAGENHVRRDEKREAILYRNWFVNKGAEALERQWNKYVWPKNGLPCMIRLRHMPDCTPQEALLEMERLLKRFSDKAGGFYLDVFDERWGQEEQAEYIEHLSSRISQLALKQPILLYVPLNIDETLLKDVFRRCSMRGWTGFVTGDGIESENGYEISAACKKTCLKLVTLLRKLAGDDAVIIANAGIHEPQDALDLVRAGANCVQLHSGLVYSGPGLPKRINEALLYEEISKQKPEQPQSFWSGWGLMFGLGIGMVLGGILAWIIATTTVLLPYDEQFLGLTMKQLERNFPQLVAFMMHDRVTLAGTMISIGILYMMLAGFAMRYRLHWAKTAIVVSGVIGFSSFFLYLGYGYFDPLHAIAAAALLPLFILGLRGKGDAVLHRPPNLLNDRAWQLAQWGQLLLVTLGIALAVGGIVIALIGITNVFVPQDLAYLCLSPDQMNEFNERLIPLIAHDRAGFGGALFSLSAAYLAAALWGVREGEKWLWWMILVAAAPGFIAAFGVHFAIGYTNFIHLLPAYIAFILYVGGLWLTYPYLVSSKSSPIHDREIRSMTS